MVIIIIRLYKSIAIGLGSGVRHNFRYAQSLKPNAFKYYNFLIIHCWLSTKLPYKL